MTKGHCSYAVSVLAGLGLLALSGCGQNGRTPTSPEPITSTSAAQTTTTATAAQPNAARREAGLPEAIADESRGGGHGKGGGNSGGTHHGGNGGGGTVEVHLTLQIQPDVWNTNYPRSHGTVTARISGTGLASIDLSSIMLTGTDASAAPLAPRRVQRVGNHVQAFFGKADAFATLDHPKPGDVVTVTIKLTADGAAQTLTDQVRIVGPAATSP